MTTLMSYTYWLSQFVVVGVALFWVYLRAARHFAFFRNWLIVANLAGLVCYVVVPTAPPRMLPEWGFTDTLAESGPHRPGERQPTREPVRRDAEPAWDGCVHRRVDALRARAAAACCACSGLAWPAWVAFAVLATGNHFWLDVAAGIVIALVTAYAVSFRRRPLESMRLLGSRSADSRSA